MINLFEIAPHDQSILYLLQIFGSMNGILTPPGVSISVPTYSAGFYSGSGGFTYSAVTSAVGWGNERADMNAVSLLGSMFQVFNSTVLALAALVIVYVTVMGVMASAHEGEFMGKKFDKLWMPLRMVLGVVFLIPTKTGFSTLQLIMMWFIVQGIGAADTLWGSVLTTIAAPTIIPSAAAKTMTPEATTESQMASLFQSVVCHETARFTGYNFGPAYDGVGFFCSSYGAGYYKVCASPSGLPGLAPDNIHPDQALSFDFGPGAACGKLAYCNPSTADGGPCVDQASLGCRTCKAQYNALKSTIDVFTGLAKQYVQADNDLMLVSYQEYDSSSYYFKDWMAQYCNDNGIQNCDYSTLPDPKIKEQNAPGLTVVQGIYWPYVIEPIIKSAGLKLNVESKDPQGNVIKTEVPTVDFIAVAKQNYNAEIAKEYEDNQTSQHTTQKLKQTFQTAKDLGWIFAGAFYYNIAQANNEMVPRNDATAFSLSLPPTKDNDLTERNSDGVPYYRMSYDAAKALVQASKGQTASDGGAGELQGGVSDAASSFSSALVMLTTAEDVNPLIQLQHVGYWLLITAQIIYAVIFIASLVIGIASGINIFALGTGAMNPMIGAGPYVAMLIIPLIFAILSIMVTVGGLLGVYVPLIPYLVYTIGAIGWLGACIETMVAGPLVALAILSPGGHHELLGKAEHAIMLLLNMFLRPSLMIFGLIAAMLLGTVTVGMINTAFKMVMFTIASQGASGSGSESGGWGAIAFNPLQAVLFLVAYVSLIVTSLNKCFSMIHVIPERVMTWIGGQGMSFGEDAALGETKSAVTGAASQAAGKLDAGTKAGGAAGEAAYKNKQAKGKQGAAKLSPLGGSGTGSSGTGTGGSGTGSSGTGSSGTGSSGTGGSGTGGSGTP